MNICVFDTETTSLDKPFCYNIGYIIINTITWQILVCRSFVVEQVWHNLPLFSSAYYANKRDLYIRSMKAKKTIMDKFGYICRQMRKDFTQFNVENAFAYNSNFDEKVFNFNCDWYKCLNPFDTITIKDIRGFVHEYLVDDNFKQFCEEHQYFTESGNYSTTAETLFRYIDDNPDFIEEHTALKDSEIEAKILQYCVERGANLENNYTSKRSIVRKQEKNLKIKTSDNEEYNFKYSSIRINKDKTQITLKQKKNSPL